MEKLWSILSAQASGITAEGKGQTDGERQSWGMMARNGAFQIKQGFCSKNSCSYNMHVWTLIGYESMQKTCRASNKTQSQHGEGGGGTQSPIHGWGTISNA